MVLMVAQSEPTRKQIITEIQSRMTSSRWMTWAGTVRGMKHKQLKLLLEVLRGFDVEWK
jgi:hypothetical protein